MLVVKVTKEQQIVAAKVLHIQDNDTTQKVFDNNFESKLLLMEVLLKNSTSA